jgi:hypothetical protein
MMKLESQSRCVPPRPSDHGIQPVELLEDIRHAKRSRRFTTRRKRSRCALPYNPRPSGDRTDDEARASPLQAAVETILIENLIMPLQKTIEIDGDGYVLVGGTQFFVLKLRYSL